MQKRPLEMTIIQWGLYALPFLALVVVVALPYSYVTPKAFLFRGIVDVLVVIGLVGMVRGHLWLGKDVIRIPVIAYGVFTLALAMSTLASVDIAWSMWGGIERMQGLFHSIHVLMFLLLTVLVFTKEEDWLWFFRITVGVSVAVALHSIWQWALSPTLATRQISTIGNAGYVGGYLLIHVFLTAFLVLKATGLVRVLYVQVIVVEMVALYLSGTRASLLGFALGLAAFGTCVAMRSSHVIVRRMGWAGLAIGGTTVVWWTIWTVNRWDTVKTASGLFGRLTTISDANTVYRLRAWKIAIKGVLEKPVFGWGPNNYGVVFNTFFEPVIPPGDDWFDRAHNVILDLGVTSGTIGVLAFLGLIGTVAWACVRQAVAEDRSKDVRHIAVLALFGLVVGYTVHLCFSFPVLVTTIPFVAVVGYANFLWGPPSVHRLSTASSPAIKISAALLACIVVFALIRWTLIPVNDLRQYKAAVPPVATVRGFGTADRIRQVLEHPIFDRKELRHHLGNYAKDVYRSTELAPSFQRELLEVAAAQLREQIVGDPHDLRAVWSLGAVLYDLALIDRAMVGEAIEVYRTAVAIGHMRPKIYLGLAGVLAVDQNIDEAEGHLREAVLLSPTWIEPRIQLMMILIATRQESQLQAERRQVEALMREQRPEGQYLDDELGRIAASYRYIGDMQMADDVIKKWASP